MKPRIFAIGLAIALTAALAPPHASADGAASPLCIMAFFEQSQNTIEPVTPLKDLGITIQAPPQDSASMWGPSGLPDDDGSGTAPWDDPDLLVENDWAGRWDGLSVLTSQDREFAFWDHYRTDDQGTDAKEDDLHHYWVTGVSDRMGCFMGIGCHEIPWPGDFSKYVNDSPFSDTIEGGPNYAPLELVDPMWDHWATQQEQPSPMCA